MKYLVYTLLLFITLSTQAQVSKEVERQQAILKQAKNYNDGAIARAALYQLISLQPEKKEWKDSLLYVYFAEGNYVSTLLLSKELLEKEQKPEILERKAIAEQQLGLLKEALESYESLFKLKGESFYLYQVATIQYQLKRFGECEITINALLNDSKTKEEKVTISLGQQGSQEVAMEAALLNIKGVMLKDIGKEEEAKKLFNKAVEISPEFVLAKANLEVLEKETKAAPQKTESTQPQVEDKKKKK